jgi:protein-S-isoprenylcysteine O-methyltransferase Ste14
MKRLGMLGLTLVFFLIQFGLAALGWGGVGPFFAHRAFVALAVASLVLGMVGLFTEGNISPGEEEDRSNRWVLGAFTLLSFAMAWLPAYTDRIGFWTLDGETMRWAGLVAMIAGSILRLVPVFILGRRFSGLVAIQQGHTLVTDGLYKTIRNPSYLGLIVSSLGWVLVFRSGAGIVLVALMMVPLVARMNAEEKLLHEHFGSEYDAYRARTWRLIPGFY